MGLMKRLIEQIIKFGIVGVIAFLIDFGLLNLLVHFGMNAVVAGTISFTISLIFNYLASMRCVFVHRPDMAQWMEILIFVVSSVIGLGINDWIIWIGTGRMLPAGTQTSDPTKYQIYTIGSKLVATVVVMVWNFLIRKWLLDAPKPGTPIKENSVAHKIGIWSLNHGPQSSVDRRAAETVSHPANQADGQASGQMSGQAAGEVVNETIGETAGEVVGKTAGEVVDHEEGKRPEGPAAQPQSEAPRAEQVQAV